LNPLLLLLIYCLALVALSLFGGWLPSYWKWTHVRIQLVMSFIAGFMLGVAFVQLLPHSYQILGDGRIVGLTMMGGLLCMFFLIRIFDFHHHHFPEHDQPGQNAGQGTAHRHSSPQQRPEAVEPGAGGGLAQTGGGTAGPAVAESRSEPRLSCAHDHDHTPTVAALMEPRPNTWAWLGLLFGLSLHSMMEGVALSAALRAADFQAAATGTGVMLAGFGIFLAIALHKPLDAMSIASIMSVSHWSRREQLWVNLLFAMSAPLAAALAYFGFSWIPADTGLALGFALAFSAGTFLCISLGDLLPELHFHSHDRLKLSVCLLAGVVLAVVLELLPFSGHQW